MNRKREPSTDYADAIIKTFTEEERSWYETAPDFVICGNCAHNKGRHFWGRGSCLECSCLAFRRHIPLKKR